MIIIYFGYCIFSAIILLCFALQHSNSIVSILSADIVEGICDLVSFILDIATNAGKSYHFLPLSRSSLLTYSLICLRVSSSIVAVITVQLLVVRRYINVFIENRTRLSRLLL